MLIKNVLNFQRAFTFSRSYNMYRMYSAKKDKSFEIKKKDPANAKEIIMLLDENKKVLGVKSKAEALVLAHTKKMMLSQVNDLKWGTKNIVYQMMPVTIKRTTHDFKILTLNSNISDRDLEMKLNNCKKWLEKNLEIRIAISGSSHLDIYNKFEATLSTGKFVQKRIKDNVLKCSILPPKPP